MKMTISSKALIAGLLLLGVASNAAAQTETQDHDAHHPAQTQAAPENPSTPDGTTDEPGMASGMGMMTPQMMQMMQRMMSGMMQQGMAGQGMMGQGMSGSGMTMCPMMAGGGSGMTSGAKMGAQNLILGVAHPAPEEMTPERVRTLLEQQLASLANPRLKLGAIATLADGSITAEIVTVDGSIVQKLAFNRYPGLVRQVN
jgi:hypothetical protein